MKRLVTAALIVVALGLSVWSGIVWWSAPTAALKQSEVDRWLLRARTALARQQYREAEEAVGQILSVDADHPEALLVRGEVAMREGDFTRAAKDMQQVDANSPQAYGMAQFALGDMARVSGRLSDAEAAYRRSIAAHPDIPAAYNGLAFVFNMTGRRWEAVPWMLRELTRENIQTATLTQVGQLEQLIYNKDYIDKCLVAAPDDPLPKLAVASIAMRERRWSEARSLFDQVLSERPDLMDARIRLGQVLYESGLEREFLIWHSGLPEAVEQHPDLWALRGSWCRSHQQFAEAMRCYWEAIRRDPSHRVAVYQLGQLCQTQGRSAAADVLLPRAERLQALADRLNEIHLAPGDWNRIADAARLTAELGRWWEAHSWALIARRAGINDPWVAQTLNSSARLLPHSIPLSREVELDAALTRLDFSDNPLPHWPAADSVSDAASALAAASSIRFEDVAGTLGLDFQYFNSADPATDGMRMLESFGGGVGAIDFDRDGWTDLYFTQGASFPPQSDSPVYLDSLFRNCGGRYWGASAADAGIVEPEFSTGVAIGDFDSDGFPDAYVANIGVNRLWRNNGDGTFTDATSKSGLGSSIWTTSCVLADLDGDGLADLYDVNYLRGEAVHTLICQADGVSRACMPTAFSAAPDEVWRNRGDGRLDSVAEAWKLDLAIQNGLGIVVADIDESGALDLFVANDAVPNNFYANLASNIRAGATTTDTAVLAGLAFDRDGKSQACMGVAAGDADSDGRLDLFVTNYYDESNTLYRQELPRLFADSTAAFGLRDPGFKMLGFGTQFLDADLDGREDLVLVNGHVDDFSHQGTPYRMRPQFFQQRDHGFDELPAATLGKWFTQEQLGRSLARLDWNRDGRMDFAVSQLDTPAALLTNHTPVSEANFVTIRLVATRSHRDAIGAILRLQVDGRELVRHLSAGDGYQAGNERSLTFGLGAADQIASLTVSWPSGDEQTLTSLAVNRAYTVIEGLPPLQDPPPR